MKCCVWALEGCADKGRLQLFFSLCYFSSPLEIRIFQNRLTKKLTIGWKFWRDTIGNMTHNLKYYDQN